MRNVICCWCTRKPNEFEDHVPLYFVGMRNMKLGFNSKIDLLFLSGLELLCDDYKDNLRAVGYTLHDASGIFRSLAMKYTALDRFGNYEKKCFLRWPVISSYFAGESIIHFDGDIVFNENPDVISGLLQGKTFVLQGCPALTSICNRLWFSRYSEQLDMFVKDIEGYSAKAWKERDGWEISEESKWAGQRFREIISSDQDFISHLIHTDRIVQDKPSEILAALHAYIVFENPLYLHGYENNLHHAAYERRAGIDFIDGRRVLIWHMQNNFNNYLGKFLFRRKYLVTRSKRLRNDPEAKDIDSYLHYLFTRYLHGRTATRLNVYTYFFEEHDFHEVLTARTWWQESAFA